MTDVFASWVNCEGGVCCTEATAIIDALVTDRDAWIKAAADNGAAKDAAEARVSALQTALDDLLRRTR